MAIRVKNIGWLSVNPQGGPHDGTYYIFNPPGGGRMIVLKNGPNLTDGTTIWLTTAADVTNFTNADSSKHK